MQYCYILRWFLLRQKDLFKDLWKVLIELNEPIIYTTYSIPMEEWKERQKNKGKWYDDYEDSFPTLKRIKDEIKKKKLANADLK